MDFMSEGTDSTKRPVELEIRCRIDTAVLPLLRTVVTALAAQKGFQQEALDQIEMAVDEACTNVIRHAYKHLGISDSGSRPEALDNPDCALWLSVQLGENHIRIMVVDRGIGYKANLEAGEEVVEQFVQRGGGGGLGVYIIRKFMDEVEYHNPEEEAGTILTMVKYLPSPSAHS